MAANALPERFGKWFESRGWEPRPHQLELLELGKQGQSALLIAPTGAGKTLAGFLPPLCDLDMQFATRSSAKRGSIPPPAGIHTLYISPLKALAVDIARNLEAPVRDMDLPVTMETRSGDTSQHKRQRQKIAPPDILMTTPEQVSLLVASREAERFFSHLRYVIFDELHSLVASKRGHLLSLAFARLRRLSPQLQAIGLSATVANPDELRAWLVSQEPDGPQRHAGLVQVAGGARPEITILKSQERVPWSGHSARYSMPEIYQAIRAHRMTILFVNTRSQAELLFRELWRLNEETLPIALHHGSLDAGQRRKVEAAMAQNRIRAVVATSTLDLGLDWGDVDLVIHVGAPKGASRLAQRIGRSNHRMDEPSRAILVPANRFEVLECQAALDANYLGSQDTPPLGEGSLDVLAQHVLAMAVAGGFDEEELFAEIRSALPYARLDREAFDRTVSFVATGGYALKSYERYARIRKGADGHWRITHPRIARQYRLNAGTIIEAPMLQVRLTRAGGAGANTKARVSRWGGRVLGKIEEGFVESLSPGDTFIFAGRTVRFETISEAACIVSPAQGKDPRVPAYVGGKFPLSTFLAQGVRAMLADPVGWKRLPDQVREWLELQRAFSQLPGSDDLLVETFPRNDRYYLMLYPFEGRLAHQTLGMLLTRRLERARARPLGFVATDYALGVWTLRDVSAMARKGELTLQGLLDEDMLGDDLEAWLDESFLLKRTFRNCAQIAGLIDKRFPGQEKTGRQMNVSSDLVYDVLRSHEPDHILLRATRQEAAHGLLDVRRLGDMLSRIRGRIRHSALDRISPLAVPVMLEIGRESIAGEANEALLAEVAEEMMAQLGNVER